MSLVWLYTCDCWVYEQTNKCLRSDSRIDLRYLASYVRGLCRALWRLREHHVSGRVYRRCKLAEKELKKYEMGCSFLWGSFVSTSTEVLGQHFGNCLFVIDVPQWVCYLISYLIVYTYM